MRALVVAPQPFFSPRGTPLSVYYRTLVTAELGVEVDLLTYGQGQDVDIPGVRIIRVPTLGLKHVKVGPSAAKLVLDVLIFQKLVALLLRNRYDFVHAHEEAVFFCQMLKKVFGFKLIYDMHSSLPQQLISFNFTRSSALIGMFERLERKALESADFLITICQDLYDYAEPIFEKSDRHLLIENSIFDPVRIAGRVNGSGPVQSSAQVFDVNELDREHPGKRLVVYAGTLEAYQGIDVVLEAFQRVVREADDAVLIVAGGSPAQVEHYREFAAQLGIAAACRFLGSVPKDVASALNRKAQVLLSPRVAGGNTPLKIYEQLASGIPLVATRIHSHTQVLTDDVAFLVAPEPDAMAAGILSALNDEQARQTRVRNALALYETKYSRPRYEAKMRRMLEVLV